jgi:diaminopropionate ammonia-lyase
LLPLPDAAEAARVASVHWKDESGRFGLGSFKALGGAYAVLRVLAVELARRGDAASATSADLADGKAQGGDARDHRDLRDDGNHGRSVAWGAQRFGCRCVVFVHPGVSKGRRDAVAAYGAEVREAPAPTTTRCGRRSGKRRRTAGSSCPTPPTPATRSRRAT